MKFKLRGTNVIAIELLTDEKNFNVEDIKKFILEKKQLLRGARFIISVENKLLKEEEKRQKDYEEFMVKHLAKFAKFTAPTYSLTSRESDITSRWSKALEKFSELSTKYLLA